MKVARSRFSRRAKPSKAPKAKKPLRLYGLPKGEVTRRLKGVNLSLRDPDVEIKAALDHVEDLLAHVRRLPCCLCGRRNNSEAHHVLTRGARNPDFFNVIAACVTGYDSCHGDVHNGKHVGVDLPAIAVAISLAYLIEHPDVARWLTERGVEAPDRGAAA